MATQSFYNTIKVNKKNAKNLISILKSNKKTKIKKNSVAKAATEEDYNRFKRK